jgi:hypothetical protein
LTLDDFLAFQADFAHRSAFSKALLGCTFVVAVLSVPVGVAIYLLTAANVTQESALSLMGFAAVNALVISVVLYWFLRRPRANFLSGALIKALFLRGDMSSIVGRYAVRLTENGIVERAPKSEGCVAFSAVQKTILAQQHLFIYVSPLAAFIVPRRAFPDPAAMEAFITALERRTTVPTIRD